MSKIAVIGAHGVGKTTFCHALRHELSRNRSVALVSEVARDCPYGINDRMSFMSAQWIVLTQIIREMHEARTNDDVVCDRSAFDPIIYLPIFGAPIKEDLKNNYHGLYQLAEGALLTYDSIVFIRRSGKPIISDGLRDTNMDKQKAIDAGFVDAIEDLKELMNLEGTSSPKLFEFQSNDVFEKQDHLLNEVLSTCTL